jgi:fatty-acyl-CoA synthase
MVFRAHDWVAHHAAHQPGAPALGCAEDGHTVTWGELDDRVGRVAQTLQDLGIRKGDRVALVAENDPRVFEVQFAAMRLGALFVPLNWRLTVHEMAEICVDAEPGLIVHDTTWADAASQIAEKASIPHRTGWTPDRRTDTADARTDYDRAAATADYLPPEGGLTFDDPTHILYTSGTTGKPKGALSTNATLVWQALNTAHVSSMAMPGNHQINQMPLFHAGGLNVMANPILYFGGMVTTITRFVPEHVFEMIAASTPPVTHMAGIPMMYEAIADQPGFADADLSNIRCFVVAGAIATPELLQLWADHGVALQPQYGGTEHGPMGTGLDHEDALLEKAKQGSTGRKAFHTDVRIVDADGADVPDEQVGEIWLRGPSVTPGYWKKDRAEFFSGEWYRTGDAGYRDADGYYYLSGRTKEMYKSGGENVYPAEVERVLGTHPKVEDLAVVGVPDQKWGEVGIAVVVPVDGAEPTLDELHEFGGDRLARYKLPKRLAVVPDLPRNVTGKVSRQTLREQYK